MCVSLCVCVLGGGGFSPGLHSVNVSCQTVKDVQLRTVFHKLNGSEEETRSPPAKLESADGHLVSELHSVHPRLEAGS